MNAYQYVGRSNVLGLEMFRIRIILDNHAYAKALGVITDDSPLIQKTYRDLENVVQEFKTLNKEFWGYALPGEE
jgi:hypothetical protein